jgi:inosine-uridine nucleoside N-ribohydrolase
LTLVCTGPSTNLAIALNVEPRLPALLRGVVAMAGAFEVSGNVSPVAEFNVFGDPEATQQALAAPFSNLTLLGLDVTQQVALPRAMWADAAEGESGDAATRLVVEVCRQVFTERGFASFYLHDPLAIAVALDPSLVQVEAASVAVGTSEGERGVTRVVGPGSVKVARTVDADRFHDRFFATLGLRGRRRNEVEKAPESD